MSPLPPSTTKTTTETNVETRLSLKDNASSTPPPTLLLIVTGVAFIAMSQKHRAISSSFSSEKKDTDLGAVSSSLLSSSYLSFFDEYNIFFLLLGLLLIIVGLILSSSEPLQTQQQQQQRGRVNVSKLSPEQILDLLMNEIPETPTSGGGGNNKTNSEELVSSDLTLECLAALTNRCVQEQQRRTKKPTTNNTEGIDEMNTLGGGMHKPKQHELEIICHDAAYIALDMHTTNDEIVTRAFALLSLIASDEEVRNQTIQQADRYGLDLPIFAMKESLSRIRNIDDENNPIMEEVEHLSAELQQRGCLFLGAICDGDAYMASRVVDEGGLDAVLDAADWYRFHEHVVNWSLWSIFAMCYDHGPNKDRLVHMDGIRRICRAMADVPESIDVARHAIAVLFDLLRDTSSTSSSTPSSPTFNKSSNNNNNTDLVKLRTTALNAGIHDIILHAMVQFPKSMEIIMMGQQMLLATGFTGDVPKLEDQ